MAFDSDSLSWKEASGTYNIDTTTAGSVNGTFNCTTNPGTDSPGTGSPGTDNPGADEPEVVLSDQGSSGSGGGAFGYLLVLLLGGIKVKQHSRNTRIVTVDI